MDTVKRKKPKSADEELERLESNEWLENFYAQTPVQKRRSKRFMLIIWVTLGLALFCPLLMMACIAIWGTQ